MSITAYIGFGSNLGDVLKNFHVAKTKLGDHDQIQLKRASRLYQSEALTVNGEKQPWYLNCAFEIETSLSLHKLFEALKKIETSMGRKHRKRWASRIIDLDILFYGDVIYADRELKIPHPEMIHRKFVLTPLCDLIPDFIHPDIELSMREILENTSDSLEIKPLMNQAEAH